MRLVSKSGKADELSITASNIDATGSLVRGLKATGTGGVVDVRDETVLNEESSYGSLSLSTAASAKYALSKIQGAIELKDSARAAFGYKMNLLRG